RRTAQPGVAGAVGADRTPLHSRVAAVDRTRAEGADCSPGLREWPRVISVRPTWRGTTLNWVLPPLGVIGVVWRPGRGRRQAAWAEGWLRAAGAGSGGVAEDGPAAEGPAATGDVRGADTMAGPRRSRGAPRGVTAGRGRPVAGAARTGGGRWARRTPASAAA